MAARLDRQIVRIESDIRRVEQEAGRTVQRYLVRVRTAALKMLERRQVPSLKEPIAAALKDTVRDSMVLTDLLGRKRSFLEARHAGSTLSLSVFTEAIKVLSRQLEVDIDALQERYDTEALRVLDGATETAERELREAILFTVQRGYTTRDATDYLKIKFDRLGLSPRNSYSVENIVRTQTQIAYNAGRWNADQHPDVQEILWGYKYVTTGDDRVRPVHEALDGVTLPKDDPFWKTFWPPNGWSCRCQVIPVFSKRSIVRPKIEGIRPDEGFAYNPGVVFNVAS